MTTRLIGPEPCGFRWTPDRTIRVAPFYDNPHMGWDWRNKPAGYWVHDTLAKTTVKAINLVEACEVTDGILSLRPRLLWSDWGPVGKPLRKSPRRYATVRCSAFSTVGHLGAFVRLQEDSEHRGMWKVWFNIVAADDSHSHFRWLSDIRHSPHRLLNVRAAAEHEVFRRIDKQEGTA